MMILFIHFFFKFGGLQETGKELEQHCRKNGALSIRAYAVSFLKCDKPDVFHNQAEVPLTPDRISDSGVLDLSWEDSLTEVWIITKYLCVFVFMRIFHLPLSP